MPMAVTALVTPNSAYCIIQLRIASFIFEYSWLAIRYGDAKYPPDLHFISDLSISTARHKDRLLSAYNKTVVHCILLH